MKKRNLLFSFLIFCTFFSSCSPDSKIYEPVIIPKPNQIESRTDVFKLRNDVPVSYQNNKAIIAATLLGGYLSDAGIRGNIKKEDIRSKRGIFLVLQIDADSLSESYTLTINPKSIEIYTGSVSGLGNGIQTLRQLIYLSKSHNYVIPCLTIKDSPRFPYRGMHLDVARHFMPTDFVKMFIDYIALFRMNYFHWHLVDDQGWRIEIKRYPKLTEIGSKRRETLIGKPRQGTEKYDGIPYSGYYTQEEIKEIVAYAADRNITVIPEIELPGHSQAAVASYQFLGCTDKPVEVATKWGISKNIYNVEDTTFKFLEGVFDEVISLFPSKYIHIGGDEAMKDQWKESRSVQLKMKKLGIKSEEELQSYFVKRIETYLNSKGKIMIGWDEILEGGLAPNAIVMSWRGEKGGIEAAKQNHQVIMTPTRFCYFDYYQSKDPSEPLAIGGFLPVDKVYSYDPVPKELTPGEGKMVLGAQGNVWTEFIPSASQVEYMIFPRMMALAEVVWTNKENQNYEDFLKRLKGFESYLIEKNINYAKHVFEKPAQ